MGDDRAEAVYVDGQADVVSRITAISHIVIPVPVCQFLSNY